MLESKAGRESYGRRLEVDIADQVQFGFPVQGQVEWDIDKFIVQAQYTHRPEARIGGMVILHRVIGLDEPQIAAAPVKPLESFGTERLMHFIQCAQCQWVSEGEQGLDRRPFIQEMLKGNGIVDRRLGAAQPDA